MNTLLKLAAGLGVIALAAHYFMEETPAKTVTDKFGAKWKVKSVNGSMCYYYDKSWIPVKYLGKHGSVVRGDRLVEL